MRSILFCPTIACIDETTVMFGFYLGYKPSCDRVLSITYGTLCERLGVFQFERWRSLSERESPVALFIPHKYHNILQALQNSYSLPALRLWINDFSIPSALSAPLRLKNNRWTVKHRFNSQSCRSPILKNVICRAQALGLRGNQSNYDICASSMISC
jgi:hypothetical protein